MRFKDLAIGQVFNFDYTRFSSTFHSIEPGPWVKISPRKYAKKGMECRIGSGECLVYVIEQAKPTWEDFFIAQDNFSDPQVIAAERGDI